MSNPRPARAWVLLLAALTAGCGSTPATRRADPSSPPASAENSYQAGSLSVTAFRFTGWRDETFHYVPALSVAAPSTGRAIFVERLDFTSEDAGARRLLKGVHFATTQRVAAGGVIDLATGTESSGPAEITSSSALSSITAFVFFTDDEGQPGIVTASADAPTLPQGPAIASLAIRDFTVDRRRHQGRFFYSPKLTLAETSGRSRASIKKIVFELPDVSSGGRIQSVWHAPDVPAGGTIRLQTRDNDRRPWLEIDSSDDASRISVVVSFVDAEGRGGLVSAVADVAR